MSSGPLFMVLAALCWSFGGLCIKFIPWDPMSIIGIRATLAAFVFAGYRKSLKVSFTPTNLIAALCLAGTTILFVFANKLTSAAAAIFLQFTAPIFIILIQLFFYKKRPLFRELIAVIVTFLGMLLFFVGKLDGGNSLGNLLAILSGLMFAGVFVCNAKGGNTQDSLFLGFLINAAIGLPFAFSGTTAAPIAWIAVIFLGTIQVGVAYIFFSIGIKKTSALTACLITALEPVLNPVWVAIFVGEFPSVFAILGGIVIVATVVWFNLGLKN